MMILIEIREATLSDIEGITEVHKSDVDKWYRVIGSELKEDSYENLTIEERWLHGGQWMSIETCYEHYKLFTREGGKIFVAISDGKIVGEVEFIVDREPPPYLEHAEIYVLMIHKDYRGIGIGSKLIKAVENCCNKCSVNRVLISSEERSISFYKKIGYKLFEEYETLSIDLQRVPRVEKMVYEPLNKINRDLLREKLLIIGRFHNTKATLYNMKYIYPFGRISLRYHQFRIIDNEAEHILVIRKSNLINNSIYCWIDPMHNSPSEIYRALLISLSIAKKLGITDILVALRKDILEIVHKNRLRYKSIEKIPWFIKESRLSD